MRTPDFNPRGVGLRAAFLFSVATLGLALPGPAQDPPPSPTLAEALGGGKAKVSLRYRFETVNEDAFAKDAQASTLRTTLGYSTLPYKGFSLALEAENVSVLGNDELYSNRGAGSLSNRVFDRPVVADPALTELSQVLLRYSRGKTSFDLGRREINLHDQRFLGAVGWRQNHQEFDAFTLTTTALARTELTYAFLNKVHRIFGDSLPMSSHLLDAAVKLGERDTLTVYGYLLDYDRPAQAALSTRTLGAELTGSKPLGAWSLLYELELADQSDAADNPRSIDASYLHAAVGAKGKAITAKLGWEVLGGDRRDGQFQTPLATLHKWNGWADKFLSTPADGLEDLYLSLSGKVGAVEWTVVGHDFQAESRSASYGQEVDVQLIFRTAWKQVFALKAAVYRADTFSTNTEKIMLWSAYSF